MGLVARKLSVETVMSLARDIKILGNVWKGYFFKAPFFGRFLYSAMFCCGLASFSALSDY